MTTTVKSGFWSNTYSFNKGRSPNERRIARLLNKHGQHVVRELATTLNGATAGSTALKQRARKQAVAGQQGGAQTIETQDLVNRATTAADLANLNTYLFTYPNYANDATIPSNGDGNPRGVAGG